MFNQKGTFSSCDHELWPTTLTFEFDLWRVKLNQHAGTQAHTADGLLYQDHQAVWKKTDKCTICCAQKCKGKGADLYGAQLRPHLRMTRSKRITVLPAPIRLSTNRISHPTFTPSRRASPRFDRYSFPVHMREGGWVDLGGWLHTEVVYPPKDGHQSDR